MLCAAVPPAPGRPSLGPPPAPPPAQLPPLTGVDGHAVGVAGNVRRSVQVCRVAAGAGARGASARAAAVRCVPGGAGRGLEREHVRGAAHPRLPPLGHQMSRRPNRWTYVAKSSNNSTKFAAIVNS